MDEVNRLKEDWMAKEREIEWLRRELERARGELEAVKGRDGFGAMMPGQEQVLGQVLGQSTTLTQSEKDDLEELWACYGEK